MDLSSRGRLNILRGFSSWGDASSEFQVTLDHCYEVFVTLRDLELTGWNEICMSR